jgi:alpha-acetolactate decarboxylase
MARSSKPLAGHAYHAKSDAELRYIMKDAAEAYAAISTFDRDAANKYADQVNDAATVLYYRAQKEKRAANLPASRAAAPMF